MDIIVINCTVPDKNCFPFIVICFHFCFCRTAYSRDQRMLCSKQQIQTPTSFLPISNSVLDILYWRFWDNDIFFSRDRHAGI